MSQSSKQIYIIEILMKYNDNKVFSILTGKDSIENNKNNKIAKKRANKQRESGYESAENSDTSCAELLAEKDRNRREEEEEGEQ